MIGDSCKDVYEYGECERLNPEAPVPVFNPKYSKENGGMASNVFNNLASLGAAVFLHTNSEEIIKKRFVEQKTNYILLRIDSGEEAVTRVDGLTKKFLQEFEAIVVSDYDKGFLLEEDIEYICKNHPLVFIDTKKDLSDWVLSAAFIKINEKEYEKSKNFIEFNDNTLSKKLIVTLSERGCVYDEKSYSVENVGIKDLTGAGDTFLAGLVYKYIESRNVDTSIKFANKCATAVVQQKGVNVVNTEKI